MGNTLDKPAISAVLEELKLSWGQTRDEDRTLGNVEDAAYAEGITAIVRDLLDRIELGEFDK